MAYVNTLILYRHDGMETPIYVVKYRVLVPLRVSLQSGYTRTFLGFFSHLVLSRFWTSRGHRCRPFLPPGSCLQFLSRIWSSKSSPTARRFFIECCLLTPSRFPQVNLCTRKSPHEFMRVCTRVGFELTKLLFFCLFHSHTYMYFLIPGQAVVTCVVPSSPRFLPSVFIAHRVQQSHFSSIFHRVLLTHALAFSASQFVHKKESPRIYTSMHSKGFDPTKLIYPRLEDNLIRHRRDRHNMNGQRKKYFWQQMGEVQIFPALTLTPSANWSSCHLVISTRPSRTYAAAESQLVATTHLTNIMTTKSERERLL